MTSLVMLALGAEPVLSPPPWPPLAGGPVVIIGPTDWHILAYPACRLSSNRPIRAMQGHAKRLELSFKLRHPARGHRRP